MRWLTIEGACPEEPGCWGYALADGIVPRSLPLFVFLLTPSYKLFLSEVNFPGSFSDWTGFGIWAEIRWNLCKEPSEGVGYRRCSKSTFACFTWTTSWWFPSSVLLCLDPCEQQDLTGIVIVTAMCSQSSWYVQLGSRHHYKHWRWHRCQMNRLLRSMGMSSDLIGQRN